MKQLVFVTVTALSGVLALLVSADAQPVTAVAEFQPAIHWHGRAVAVIVSPADTFTAIVASESGGLFKTTDHGSSWYQIGRASCRERV